MSTTGFPMPLPSEARSLSPIQRTLLAVAAAAILMPQLLRIPSTISFLREEHFDSFAGAAFALVSSTLFATQLFRGRWLVGTCCFLVFLVAVTLFGIASMPAYVADIPLRRLFFATQIPSIAAYIASLGLILYARRLSNRNDRNA